MKLLVTSDWHLDAYTAGVQRFDDVAAAVQLTVDAAKKHKVDAYAFLGDLCDPPARSHRAVAYAIDVAHKLGKTPSLWLTGNHDVIEDGHGTSTLQALKETVNSRVTVVDRPEGGLWPPIGAYVICLPYTPRSHTYDPVAFIEEQAGEYKKHGKGRPAIVVGHLCIEGMHPGSETTEMPRGRDVFLPLAAIAEHFPDAFVLNGHYHKQCGPWADKHGNMVWIPGSLERLTFGEESNQPGYFIVEHPDG